MLKILIVDDEESIRRSLKILFSSYDCEITEAISGNTALALIKRYSFDLVISDVEMLDGTGFDLLKGFRSLNKETPFIFLTGNTRIKKPEILEMGASGLIDKFDIAQKLVPLISSLLNFPKKKKP